MLYARSQIGTTVAAGTVTVIYLCFVCFVFSAHSCCSGDSILLLFAFNGTEYNAKARQVRQWKDEWRRNREKK